jgi:hypothetical protein
VSVLSHRLCLLDPLISQLLLRKLIRIRLSRPVGRYAMTMLTAFLHYQTSNPFEQCADSDPVSVACADGSGVKGIADVAPEMKEQLDRRSMDSAFAPMVPQNTAPPRVNPCTSFGSVSSQTGVLDPNSPRMTEMCGGGANAVTV